MLNFALIGCGKVSKKHLNVLTSDHIKGAKLVAICDKNETIISELSSKYNVPSFTDMHKMLETVNNIDVVTILTPSGSHAEVAIQLAKYKKHIVIEKPMALTLEDADTIIKECDNNQVKVFVVKQNRFNIPILKLKEAIDQNRLGKLVMGTVRLRWKRTQEYYDQDHWRGTWKYDGGVLSNQASHHIDLLEWLLGDVESVFAKSTTALANIEVEDTAVVILKFKNGALGIIEATTATRPKDLEGSISILGEKGSVVIGGFAANKVITWDFVDNNQDDLEFLNIYSDDNYFDFTKTHKSYYEHVIDCITNNKSSLIDGLEGRKSLELITAIYESIETGQEVFLRFKPDKCKLGH